MGVLVRHPQAKQKPATRAGLLLAGGEGFEPPLAESESAVLPLDEPPNGIDLVHAAFNGRGKFFSARDPSLLKQSLAQILAEATQPSGSAAAAGSVRSSIIAGGFLYQTIGDPNDWSGGLLARPVSTGNATTDNGGDNHANCDGLDVGEPCAPVWNAAQAINGQDWNGDRLIDHAGA